MSHYDEIQDFICSEIADEEAYFTAEEERYAEMQEAMQEELAWYNWARSMGYE